MSGPASDQRSWLAQALFPDGTEPDPRFTLANERTFLAWVRTSLAFLAGGIALQAFDLPTLSAQAQRLGAVAVVAVALLIALIAAARWVRVERAMRHHRPLPAPALVPIVVIALIIGSLVVLVGLAR